MEVNPCVVCGIDMGPTNPRQLCGKTYCFGIASIDDEYVFVPRPRKKRTVSTRDPYNLRSRNKK